MGVCLFAVAINAYVQKKTNNAYIAFFGGGPAYSPRTPGHLPDHTPSTKIENKRYIVRRQRDNSLNLIGGAPQDAAAVAFLVYCTNPWD